MSRSIPKIAEAGVFNLTGGALDGSRVRVVDPRKALLTFLVYRDPESGEILSDIQCRTRREVAVRILRDAADAIEAGDVDPS